MRLIPFRKQQRELMPLFDDFIDKFFHEEFAEDSHLMAIDVLETEKDFLIRANLPGILKENVNISIKENQLILEACHEEKKIVNNECLIRSERYLGKYQRMISLPDICDSENIKAKLLHGVLELSIPKKEPTPKKKVEIQ